MQMIVSLSARHESLPLREPFETARRRSAASETVRIDLRTESGTVGHGAATPAQYVTGETVESVLAAVGEAAALVTGRRAAEPRAIAAELARALPNAPAARAGIEIAIIDAAGKLRGVPSYALFGGTAVVAETDITIPIVPPEHAAELAHAASERGFRFFKVKVGGKSAEEDLARAIAIAGAAAASSLLIDANQGFSPDGAVAFARALLRHGVSVTLFEQPVDKRDFEGLAYVARSIDVPVFADESACDAASVARLAESRSAAGVNVKLMKSGFFGALAMADAARAAGLALMLGCMVEPRVGIAAALHLACIAPEFQHFDLDADLLLAREGSGGFIRNGSEIGPVTAPGLGCQHEA